MVKKTKKKDLEKLVDLTPAGIKEFIDFTKQFNITSLSIGQKGKKITVTKNISVQPLTLQTPEPAVAPKFELPVYESIKSTFVGSFALAKNIKAGKEIKEGEIVANINSMKIEHPVKAVKDCKIKEILVQDNDPIEYGKPLFFIE